MNTAKELAETELFKDLAPELLAAFAAIAREAKYEPGKVVYETGTAGDSFFIIVAGEFAVRVKDEHGEEVDVATLKPGSYFGEMEVIGGMNRTAAVVSEGDGRCYRFDATTLVDLLKRNEKLAAHFYRQVCRELIKRLKSTTRDMGYFKARAG
ncbi:MAG: cyclic nucleotide-binding domain-containing protein [Deltaproteobacteria bacterium]|nr:cyclic nucleotide-binding domain-containing protein [Deltaproteobacteria bacterium]